jgi:hypothetical protein
MKTPEYRSIAAQLLISAALTCTSLQADSSIGVNFAGANVHGTPTRLDRTDLAGVVPQDQWNNFQAHSATRVLLRDNSGQVTSITVSYLTQEMYGSGTYGAGAGGNADAKLLNGYLNAFANDTNTVTFAGLNPAETYSVIVYCVRETSQNEDAFYWIGDDYSDGPWINYEGAADWLTDPQFRRATNVLGSPDTGNYVRLDNLAPEPDGTLSVSTTPALNSDRAPINGIQLLTTGSFPPTTETVAIQLQPRNASVPAGQSGTFRVVANGPWDYQWYSNNVAIPGATLDSFTTEPLLDQLGTRADYHVIVSNGGDQVVSDTVHLILVPALPPGGIFYDAFDYPEGSLGNWGEWTLQNTAQVAAPGLTYSDGTNSLQVSGNTMVAPIDWDPFENIPIKLFGNQTYGGPNSTVFMSFLFDFRNLNSTNNSGYVGVSGFEGSGGWGSERFFVGKTWYGDFITVDGRIPDSTIPYHTNGFLVLRLTQSDTSATYDLFLNPPLTALPETPTATGTTDGTFTFNGVGVNAGEWAGPKDNHNVPFTAPGPLVDEFRFGETYASVAPIALPALAIEPITIDATISAVRLSWPAAFSDFALQTSSAADGSAPWVAAPAGNPVEIPVDGEASFFRLVGP